jgi:hypothetical protein
VPSKKKKIMLETACVTLHFVLWTKYYLLLSENMGQWKTYVISDNVSEFVLVEIMHRNLSLNCLIINVYLKIDSPYRLKQSSHCEFFTEFFASNCCCVGKFL